MGTGAHMVPILNNVPVAAACVGNHELDMGVPQFEYLASQCNFPWLLANVIDPALRRSSFRTRAEVRDDHVVDWSQTGLIGLAGKVNGSKLRQLPCSIWSHTDPVDSARADTRTSGPGAEMIIALCHQREVHDTRLAEEVPDIDIILSGHDHHYRH